MALLDLGMIAPRRLIPLQRSVWTALTLLLCLTPPPLFCQHPNLTFEHLSTDKGLAHPSTYDILQDRQGFVWFATETGMCRYDGYGCVTIAGTILPSLGGAQNLIYKFMETRSGIFWAATPGGGFLQYDPARDSVLRITAKSFDRGNISSNSAYALLEDSRGTLWFGTAGGLDTLDRSTGRFAHVRFGPLEIPDSTKVTELYESPSTPGIIWIGTWGRGLVRLNRHTGTWTSWETRIKDSTSLADNFIRDVFLPPTNPLILWTATEHGGLNRLDLVSGKWKRYLLDSSGTHGPSGISVRCIIQDPRGILYVGSSGGLHTYDPANESFRTFSHDPDDPRSLSHDNVRSLRFDEEGNLWIATRQDINRSSPLRANIHTCQYDPNYPRRLPGTEVQGIAATHQGLLWVATSQGLAQFDPRKGTWKAYLSDPHRPGSLRTNQLWNVYIDRAGTLWVCGTSGLLHRYRPDTDSFDAWQITSDPANASINQILCMHEDRSGRFWLGTYEGLYLFDRRRGNWTRVGHDGQRTDRSLTSTVYAILEDRENNLWVGTEHGGLLRLNPATATLDPVPSPSAGGGLSTKGVASLLESKDGSLWVGTRDGGLSRFDRTSGSFTRNLDPGGPTNNSIMSIIEDDTGFLWMGTNNGLYCLDPRTGRWRRLDVQDGMQSNHFHQAAAKSPDGTLSFGGTNGLTFFHPDSVLIDDHIPKVFLTDYRLNEQKVRVGEGVTYLERVVIPASAEVFSFEFAALDYHRPDKILYAYMLDRINREWVYAANRRYVAYTRPDPGSYVFRVKASNSAGVWNDKGIAIMVMVEPRLWETWWFRLLILLVIIGALVALFRFRLSRLLAMERLRMGIAGDLHDEIGTGLSSIALTTELVQRTLPPETANAKALSETLQAARTLADKTRDIVWLLAPEQERLSDLVSRMCSEADRLLASIDHTFDIVQDNPKCVLEMEFRRHILLMFKEMLHNIVRHAHASHVDIKILQQEDQLSIMVRDNGVGFMEETPRSGYGLRGLQHRASLIGARVTVESTPGKGTTGRLVAKIPQTRD
jgi:ligand-binding sensor domain-containing protein/two-component sensor histidine kinase